VVKVATQLVLAQNPGWVTGEQIVVSQTEYSTWNTTQVEVCTIAAISTDGKTVTLSTPLKHRHYAGPVTASASSPANVKAQWLAGAAGVITRNVVIKGDVTNYHSASTYGGHVWIGKLVQGTKTAQKTFLGRMMASAVRRVS
jgi:hypothetical protein